MPPLPSDEHHSRIILEAVQNNTYPESQELISSELSSSTLSGLINRFDSARRSVEEDIRKASKSVAPDVDGWITQAQRLQSDIFECQAISRSIVTNAKDAASRHGQVRDASNKVALLQNEVAFNESLVASLKAIRSFQDQVRETRQHLSKGRDVEAADQYLQVEHQLAQIEAISHSRVSSILRSQSGEVQQEVKDAIRRQWLAHLNINAQEGTVELGSKDSIGQTAQRLQQLGLLRPYIGKFCREFTLAILSPLLQPRRSAPEKRIETNGNTVRLSNARTDHSIPDLLDDLLIIFKFLNQHLPEELIQDISRELMPRITSILVDHWLSNAIPRQIQDLDDFWEVLNLVQAFTINVGKEGWSAENLIQWTQNFPQTWLDRRKERALTEVRKAISGEFGDLKAVTRKETRMVATGEGVFATSHKLDEWDDSWSNDGENLQPDLENPTASHPDVGHDDEDVSAWGLEGDDEAEEVSSKSTEDSVEVEGNADAWGWNDDQEDKAAAVHTEVHRRASRSRSSPVVNGQQEVTLEEHYNITTFPGRILEVVNGVLKDAQELSGPKYVKSSIASATSGLYSTPSLILAFYRASAPAFYTSGPKANMLLYNDGLWLSEQLGSIASKYAVPKPRIETDVKALEHFAKGAYSRELEAQKTILSDLMDGAQGFENCTEMPISQECDIAITSTVDRLRYLDSEWRPVLSWSALLQSLGILLGTVINKMMNDIEDMPDISETMSQRLAAYCGRVTLLGDLFTPQSAPSPEAEDLMPVTAVYTPGWLRFQYLSNILESTLVDIKYLWIEGELSLEMTENELISLIEALFSDSDIRRRAIGEIKRHSKEHL